MTNDINKLIDLADKRDEVNFAFIKHLLLMASGLLGILASLHKTTANTDNICSIRIAFGLAVLLLPLGILFLSIALYGQVFVGKAKFLVWKEELQKRILDADYKHQKFHSGNRPKIYTICEFAGYISFVLSIISLSIYAILIS